MKRRSFIRNISSLGLASVAVGTSFAAETPQSNSLPGKSKIPVYDGWDVIVVGGGPSGKIFPPEEKNGKMVELDVVADIFTAFP